MPRATLDRLRGIFTEANPYLMYGLTEAFRSTYLDPAEVTLWMEFMLYGLAEKSRIGRSTLAGATRFTDMLGTVFSESDDDEDEDDEVEERGRF